MKISLMARVFLSALLGLACTLVPARAETPIESSAETRFQLDLQVPDAAIKSFLPAGWTMNVSTSGNAKDCNLRLIFVDRLTINGPDGKPVGKGSQRYVYLELPVKDAQGEATRLVIGGITESEGAPGPFGNYLPAVTQSMQRDVSTVGSNGAGVVLETQLWAFRAASGEFAEMQVTFERGVNTRNPIADTKFVSAKDPTVALISRQEQVLDVVRNTTTNPPDRVRKFSLKAGGSTWSKIFDGTERMLSWDHILWVNRMLLKP